MSLDVHIAPRFRSQIDGGWVRRVAETALGAEGVSSPVELSLVIADEGLVRELNRSYRGLDEGTDVLSFSLREGDPSFVTPPDDVIHLGEVIVSYPQAVRQAEEQGHSLEQEIAHLVVHGVLHLLGYEDEVEEEEQKMRAVEERALRSIDGGASPRA